jgi:hypothetical protein
LAACWGWTSLLIHVALLYRNTWGLCVCVRATVGSGAEASWKYNL